MSDRDTRADGGIAPVLGRLPDPVVRYAVTDGDPQVRATNAAFAATFDEPDAGTPLSATLRPVGDDSPVVAAARRSAATRVERRYRTADGEGTYLVRVVPGPDGESGHVMLTDVSDYRERIDDRADRIRRLERAIAVVSHDLQNPIDYADARLDAAEETGETEHFRKVRKALDRIERISRDAMALTATDVETTASVDLETLARDAFETVDADDVTLEVGTLPTVEGDPRRLESLFENLFHNAVEHGGTTVTADSLDGGFYVADDGPGLAAGDHDRAFEPGYTTDEEGTGLGLAIVERTASAHGWTVDIDDDGDGARFEFSI